MTNETKQVEMSVEEARQFEEFKAAQERKATAEQAKRNRATYAQMVDEEVASTLPILEELSSDISSVKSKVMENFASILDMKSEVLNKVRDKQRSHTFTHSDGMRRITIGRHTCDGWKDTVNDGIAIVKEACLAMVSDDTTRALIDQIMRLLSRDSAGNLKANKVLQLRKMATDLKNDRMNEGITIIEEAYIPTFSKSYIYAEKRDEKTGGWCVIPLGMTDVLESDKKESKQ